MAAQRSKRSSKSSSTLPDAIAPMLARAATEPFDSNDHLFEIKWDGTRCIAFVEQDKLRLQNRRNIEMRARYPELECLQQLPAGTALDGEIIVLDNGKPSFSRLQQREHLLDPTRIEIACQRLPATYMVFDLLYQEGQDLKAAPLSERRERLRDVVTKLAEPFVLVPDHIVGAGKQYFAAAEAHALEGIMAKRLDSPYITGSRSPHWLKIKVARTGTFAIIGFVQRENASVVSALAIGEKHGKRWTYKGKVGSGFTEETRAAFFAQLDGAPALANPPANGPKEAQWRNSGLHCTVRYFEKTVTGMLRAPVFKGLVEP